MFFNEGSSLFAANENKDIVNNDKDEKEIYENWSKNPEEHLDDMVAYQNWFSRCTSLKDTTSMGFVDFYSRILTPEIYSIIGNPKDKTSLEIGFGGGRLMNAAAHSFKKALGIDITTEKCFAMTSKFLQEQHVENYELVHFDNVDSVPDASIDFVYSFIVFQHFSSIQFFYDYVKLIKRVLVDGGCCTLYLGRNTLNNDDFCIKNTLSEEKSNCTTYYKPEFVVKVLNA
jgi:ubiquinone/menaquinone biosynthesis C-methylase UbiE